MQGLPKADNHKQQTLIKQYVFVPSRVPHTKFQSLQLSTSSSDSPCASIILQTAGYTISTWATGA
jgi:hypothetical protein